MGNPELQQLLGLVAAAIGLVSYVPYLRDLFAGRTKPHAFSWLVWAVLTGIAFAGQIADRAGPGAWVTGLTATVCIIIFTASLYKGEKDIRRSDWLCLLICGVSIPLWLATSTPLWSMILITVVDAVAFIPTFRKSYHKPGEETAITYLISAIKFALSLLALQNFSVITALYPASLVIMNGAFVVMLYGRRAALAKKG